MVEEFPEVIVELRGGPMDGHLHTFKAGRPDFEICRFTEVLSRPPQPGDKMIIHRYDRLGRYTFIDEHEFKITKR